MSTLLWTMTSSLVAELLDRGLLDTSVVIDIDNVAMEKLPRTLAIATITLAELSAGPIAARTEAERARRQDRLQRVEAIFDPLPFDVRAARAYGRIYAGVITAGRIPRRRVADLLIASTALSEELPLITRNAGDFSGLEDLIHVVEI